VLSSSLSLETVSEYDFWVTEKVTPRLQRATQKMSWQAQSPTQGIRHYRYESYRARKSWKDPRPWNGTYLCLRRRGEGQHHIAHLGSHMHFHRLRHICLGLVAVGVYPQRKVVFMGSIESDRDWMLVKISKPIIGLSEDMLIEKWLV